MVYIIMCMEIFEYALRTQLYVSTYIYVFIYIYRAINRMNFECRRPEGLMWNFHINLTKSTDRLCVLYLLPHPFTITPCAYILYERIVFLLIFGVNIFNTYFFRGYQFYCIAYYNNKIIIIIYSRELWRGFRII